MTDINDFFVPIKNFKVQMYRRLIEKIIYEHQQQTFRLL